MGPYRVHRVNADGAQLAAPVEFVERGDYLRASALFLRRRDDTVTRSLERLQRHTPVNWLFAWQYNGLIPNAKILRSLELFATKVLPSFPTVSSA
jgi:hypothetical protein